MRLAPGHREARLSALVCLAYRSQAPRLGELHEHKGHKGDEEDSRGGPRRARGEARQEPRHQAAGEAGGQGQALAPQVAYREPRGGP